MEISLGMDSLQNDFTFFIYQNYQILSFWKPYVGCSKNNKTHEVKFRGVFRTQSDIYDEALLGKC